MRKGFAPIIILVLIALATIGYFGYKNYWSKLQPLVATSLTPTSTPTTTPSETLHSTSDWAIFENKKVGFEINNPYKWFSPIKANQIQNAEIESYDFTMCKDRACFESDTHMEPFLYINVSKEKLTHHFNVDYDQINRIVGNILDPNGSYWNKKKIEGQKFSIVYQLKTTTMSGQEVLLATANTDCDPMPQTSCYKTIKKIYYSIDKTNPEYLWTIMISIPTEFFSEEQIKNFTNEGDRILSTFKFTN